MFRISETSVKVEELETDSSDKMWTQMNKNFEKTLPFVENTIDRWNERT
jgi:hypothetical protein